MCCSRRWVYALAIIGVEFEGGLDTETIALVLEERHSVPPSFQSFGIYQRWWNDLTLFLSNYTLSDLYLHSHY